MFVIGQFLSIWLAFILSNLLHAEWRSIPKRVTVEYGSDLSLSCTFSNENNDETIVQWLYQNLTSRKMKTHWRPLFLNSQSLTSKETRYSIQQKMHQFNQTSTTYSTILTLAKVVHSDEGLYMCKSLSPKPIQMTYQVQVIESLEITPNRWFIPTNETGQYSIRLTCVLKDRQYPIRRHQEIFWWHNDRRLGSKTTRFARISQNFTENSFISTLIYTGKPMQMIGNFVCESEPLKRSVSVELQANHSSILALNLYLSVFMWILGSI